jgi:ribokinase
VIAADGTVSLEQMGGNAVYAAVGARLAGASAALAGNVPANYPQGWLDELEQSGISTAGVVRHPVEADEAEWFIHRPDGSRLDHRYAPASAFLAAGLSAERIDDQARARWLALLEARAPEGLTFGAFRRDHPVTLAQARAAAARPAAIHLAPERLETQLALARAFRVGGATVSLDPGWAARGLSSDALDQLLDAVDVFLPSEQELAALCPGQAPGSALASLARRSTATLGVKLGAAGALIMDRGRQTTTHIPALPVAAIDPTGAGDCFCGAFLAALVATGDPLIAGRQATAAASIAVEGFGALHALQAPASTMPDRLDRIARAATQEAAS